MGKKFNIDRRHVFSAVICLFFLLWIFVLNINSIIRLLESLKDLVTSIIAGIFYKASWSPDPSVLEESSIDIITYIPKSWIQFFENFDSYLALFFDQYNLLRWLIWLLPIITFISQLAMTISILALVIYIFHSIFGTDETDPDLYEAEVGKESKFLLFWKRLEKFVFIPIWNFISDLYCFITSHFWGKLFLFFFLLGSNLLSILIEAFSFIFYFLINLNIDDIPLQIYKLSVDLVISWNSLPAFLWIIIFWRCFNIITRRIAISRLMRQESHNEDVIRSLGLVVYIIARMRAGKTKMQASMQVTTAKVFRDDALDNMIKVHSHFPNFPFEKFISDLNSRRINQSFETLTAAEDFILSLSETFKSSSDDSIIYGYDSKKYGLYCDVGSILIDLFDDLQVFAKSYIVYTEPTLFVSNFSVRDLHTFINQPLLSKWDFDFFSKDAFDGDGFYSRVLNWDYLRPGKKMGDVSVYGALEFGIIGAAEINKERGNKFDHEGLSRSDESCNLKNDLCHKHLTMMGHAAMINYKCFIKMLTDGQRVSGWGADARDLSQIVTIVDTSEERLALDLYFYRELFYRLVKKLHASFVSSHWYLNRDCKLINYLVDNILSYFVKVGERVHNLYGYRVQHIDILDGTGEGEPDHEFWYSSNKKEHGGLYATDSYAEYFRNYNRKAGFGLSSMERYNSLYPSLSSMRDLQNSFMIDDFCRDNEEGGSDEAK